MISYPNCNTPFTTVTRVVRQTHSDVFTGGPSAVVFVCRRKCVVGKLPVILSPFVCALARTYCKALATTDLRRHFVHVYVWLEGPWRRHSIKRRQHHEDTIAARTKQMSVLDVASSDEMAVIFTVYKASCPKASKKKTQNVTACSHCRTFQWAMRSDRSDFVPGSFWPVRTHAMM